MPQIQSGKLKVFYDSESHGKLSAKLISTRFADGQQLAFLVEYGRGDGLVFNDIVVDVTPEKRYAVWNHKRQRFINGYGTVPFFGYHKDKLQLEVYLKEWLARQEQSNKDYYIVEWEIKNDV